MHLQYLFLALNTSCRVYVFGDIYSDISIFSCFSQVWCIANDWLLVNSIGMHPVRTPEVLQSYLCRSLKVESSYLLPCMGTNCREFHFWKDKKLVVAFTLFLMQNMSWNFAASQKSFLGLNIVIVQIQAIQKSSIYFPYETRARDKSEIYRSCKKI